MTTGEVVFANIKSEEELIQENESSFNYAKAAGKVGQALREHFTRYEDCFHKTGTAFNTIKDEH